MVNDRIVSIPSYQLRPGDVVAVRPKSCRSHVFHENVRLHRQSHAWLEMERRQLQGKFLDYPQRSDIPEKIREQLIVELYSK